MPKQEQRQPITVRKGLDFQLYADDIPKYWMAGNPFKTRVFDAVQSTFPEGERYFISSVRAFRDQITDPVLAQDVKDFMLQEGEHGRVHTEYNQRLKRQGINIDAFTSNTRRVSDARLKRHSPEYNVALTAALEHFTAMMAELFFAEKSVMAGADERIRALFAWHAIEEMEHRAVAYDVMQKVANVGYGKRTLAMTHALVDFSLYAFVSPWFMLKMDGYSLTQRLRMYVEGAAWMFGPRKGIYKRLLPMLAQYYRPGFHPDRLRIVHNYSHWIGGYGEEHDPLEASREMYAAAM